MKPDDFFTLAKKQEAEMVDLKFVDMLGTLAALLVSRSNSGTRRRSRKGSGSTARRFAAGWAFTSRTCWRCPTPTTAVLDPFFAKPTMSVIANVVDPITRKTSRAIRGTSRARPRRTCKETGIADTCYIGPEPEFFIFDEVRYEQNQHEGYYEIDSVEGAWNTGARSRSRTSVTSRASRAATSRSARPTRYHDLRGEMVYEMRKIGIVVEAHHHEVATAGQSEIDMQFQPLLKMARSVHVVQVHLQERREAARQDRDVHAEADLRGQRQRHAHAHVAVEGRQAAVRRRRVCRAERDGAVRRRRPAQARAAPSWRSPRPRRIPIAVSCRASKRR